MYPQPENPARSDQRGIGMKPPLLIHCCVQDTIARRELAVLQSHAINDRAGLQMYHTLRIILHTGISRALLVRFMCKGLETSELVVPTWNRKIRGKGRLILQMAYAMLAFRL